MGFIRGHKNNRLHSIRVREYSSTYFIFLPTYPNEFLTMMNFSLQPFPLPSVGKFDRVRRRNFSETGPCLYYGKYYCLKLAPKIVISFFVQNDENLNRNVEHRLLSDDGINCKYTRMLKSSVIMKSEFLTARL